MQQRLLRFEATGKVSVLKGVRAITSSSVLPQQPATEPAGSPPLDGIAACEVLNMSTVPPGQQGDLAEGMPSEPAAVDDDAQLVGLVPGTDTTIRGGAGVAECLRPSVEPASERQEEGAESLNLFLSGGPEYPIDTPAFCLGLQADISHPAAVDTLAIPGVNLLPRASQMPAPQFSTPFETAPHLGITLNPPDSSDATQLPESLGPSHVTAPLLQTQFGSLAEPSPHLAAGERSTAGEPCMCVDSAPVAETQLPPSAAAHLPEVYSLTQALVEQSPHLEGAPFAALSSLQLARAQAQAGTGAHARAPVCATQYSGGTQVGRPEGSLTASDLLGSIPACKPSAGQASAGQSSAEVDQGGGSKGAGRREGNHVDGISKSGAASELGLHAGASPAMYAPGSSSQAFQPVEIPLLFPLPLSIPSQPLWLILHYFPHQRILCRERQ